LALSDDRCTFRLVRLVWFTIHGYRRFEAETELFVDGHLVAITGPNEAGKSSLLDALAHLNHEDAFSPGELTRRTQIPSDQVVLRARFLLEDSDLDHVRHLHGGAELRWFVVNKWADGELTFDVEPRPRRSFGARTKAADALQRLRPRIEKSPPPERPPTEGVEEVRLDLPRLDRAIELLRSDAERLGDSAVDYLESTVDGLEDVVEAYKQIGARALDALRAAHQEESTHPEDQAELILAARRPSVLRFGNMERTLSSEYDAVDGISALPVTAAIRNLAALADLDLAELRDAIEEGDHGLVHTRVHDANTRLRERFVVSWRQSDRYVQFKTDDRLLRVLIQNPHEPANQIVESSDGMRAFVALLAYTAVQAGCGFCAP
jgi:hypothetical protein